MTERQRIVPLRRQYNQWVANQTLEDYALRFTAHGARRWSILRVANTALGAISFLALEAIGGAVTLSYGFENAMAALVVVAAIIFLTGFPISYYAAKYGVDIDLLTRGAGFGYIGSTITSLIYASFTFIFFAIEAVILSLVLEMCFGLPLAIGYVVSSVAVIPLVTHGITLISRFQLWTQPIWLVLHVLPFACLAWYDRPAFAAWTEFGGAGQNRPALDLLAFGAAATVMFSLIAQIGEQVDFLRFLPRSTPQTRLRWWTALLSAGPGWIIPGAVKIAAGSFLAVLALRNGIPAEHAAEPTQMYLVAFGYVVSAPEAAMALTAAFVVVSQLKINVTNSYAGSIAWSNFFSRLTHSHPGRVVWLVFNVAIALMLMELGIYKALEQTLGLYAVVAVAWVGALVADLVINKPLGLSPKHIEFKRAHLYDINPVGVGAMLIGTLVGILAMLGAFGSVARALAPFLTLLTTFVVAPAIAALTRGRFYLARKPRAHWKLVPEIRCRICEHSFEPDDMAFCPAYSGAICSLCCSLDARCHDLCKGHARLGEQVGAVLQAALPDWIVAPLRSRLGHYLGVLLLIGALLGVILALIGYQAAIMVPDRQEEIRNALVAVYFILMIVAGVAAWLFVLAQESRAVAQEESARQTTLLMREIEAHKRTDAALQRAKEAAEAANLAKSRYVVGLSHELRTPLNAILGYAQLLEREPGLPAPRRGGLRVIRRSAEHLSGLIDGLLDISKIEAGRLQLQRSEVRLGEFLDQLVDMFQLQARSKGLQFRFIAPDKLPEAVYTDEKRLKQILINLLSNALKFTETGQVTLRLRFRSQVAEFEIEDTGIGIAADDLARIFEPFERGRLRAAALTPGTGLGLTITKLLVEIMGGEILVASRPACGSVFTVRLLLSVVPEPRRGAAPVEAVRGYAGPRRTILVADDDAVQRELMRELLSPLGFVLLLAPDGPSCLEYLGQCRPDLFLIDVFMPGMNGFELARQIREAGHRAAPILMMSASVGEGALREIGHEAPADLIAKPVDVPRLLERIGTLLGLEWTAESPAPPAPEPAGEILVRPGPAQVEELIRLGEIGFVRGIEAKLSEIEAGEAATGPFIAEMRKLIRSYDMRGYLAALKDLRRL